MRPDRRTATIVGSLFLIAMVASLVGGAMVEGVLTEPDFLARAATDTNTLTWGVVLEFVNVLAVVGIAVALFPVFKRHGEGAALGYVGLRVLEAGALAAAAILPATVVRLGRGYPNADATAASSFEVLGDQLVALRADLTGMVVPLFFCLGALLFYAWMIRSRALPEFIAIWGFAGVAGIAVLNVIGVGMPGAMILALPIILNEVFLGIWLLVRGIGATSAAPRSAVPAA